VSNELRLESRCVKGVTLIEVAVGIVVASLLFTGVVRGSTLIASAQTKRISAEISAVTAAYLTYRDRYRSIPGDDGGAAARWAAVSNGNADGVLSGRYDDEPPPDLSALTIDTAQGESLNFWSHLRAAKLIPGPESGPGAASPPPHAVGGRMGVQQGGFGLQGPVLCLNGIRQDIASVLDRDMDDGQPGSGSLRVGVASGDPPNTEYQMNGEDLVVCVSLDGSRGGLPGPLYAQPLANGGGLVMPSQGNGGNAPQNNANGKGNGGQPNGQNGAGPGKNGNGAGYNASGK